MDDLFPLLVAIIVGILVLFGLPVVINAALNETTIDTYVTHATDVFGDQVCKDGYISREMYNDLLTSLAKTQLLYDIEMVRVHEKEYPRYNHGTFTGITDTIEDKTYTKAIVNSLSNTGIYKLKVGDRFSITVRSRSKTLMQKFYSLFRIKDAGGIVSFGGGYVVDEDY